MKKRLALLSMMALFSAGIATAAAPSEARRIADELEESLGIHFEFDPESEEDYCVLETMRSWNRYCQAHCGDQESPHLYFDDVFFYRNWTIRFEPTVVKRRITSPHTSVFMCREDDFMPRGDKLLDPPPSQPGEMDPWGIANNITIQGRLLTVRPEALSFMGGVKRYQFNWSNGWSRPDHHRLFEEVASVGSAGFLEGFGEHTREIQRSSPLECPHALNPWLLDHVAQALWERQVDRRGPCADLTSENCKRHTGKRFWSQRVTPNYWRVAPPGAQQITAPLND